MSKLDKIYEIVQFAKAQELAGIAKAKSVLDDVKSVDLPEVEDLVTLFKKEEPKKKKINWCCIFGIIAAILVIAGAIYGLYRYFTPDYLDDFDDDFEDDDFEDDDFFEDEDEKDDKE